MGRKKNKPVIEKGPRLKDLVPKWTAAVTDPVDNAWSLTIPEFKQGDMKETLWDQSTFNILFPAYREEYLKKSWPLVQKALADYHIKATLDTVGGSMEVMTTRKTWDPSIILKSRDMIRLLARSVPFEQAVKVLQDEISADIIKINTYTRNKEKFIKRRARLIGPGGCTLKSIELLTNCYVLVHGSTVAGVGPYRGLQQLRRIVEDTMNNIHPIYNIKALMIKRELARDPVLKNENWEKFLPKFKSKNISKRKQPKNKKIKKPYTPFPPAQPQSNTDKQLESGEYFLNQEQKKAKKTKEISDRHEEAQKKRQERREQAFVPPEETKSTEKKTDTKMDLDVEEIKKKVKKGLKKKNNIKPST
ncbi:KRR1 small subunit processome component homolog [Trichogramma pretiosum]|uniref:KRR1 small subunit processome component homolog n=1 Tax=Trichogramma pretiosum TaxID=7493 RepID=UPI0006C95599|nr:KRR1 small subunit processome component homolog [Trichogramma pretiosum]